MEEFLIMEVIRGIIHHVVKTLKPYITDDCEEDLYHVPFRKERIRSEMVIPFEIDRERIGMVVLPSQRKNHFNESHLKRIEPSINEFLFDFLTLEFFRFLKEKDKEADFMPYDSWIKEIFPEIRKISSSDEPVLIIGETGSGKEILSQLIHFLSKRKNKPFYPINCSSFPSEDLLQSELFGHEKGAFTGAWRKYPGKIKSADRGTLFLDEIQSSSLRFQCSLLRFIERREIHPLGSEKIEKSDVRIISACSSSPEKLMNEGKLLPPFYYRIFPLRIYIPPLRERNDKDKENYIFYFLFKKSHKTEIKEKEMSPSAMECLKRYPFPGNIRELKGVIERAVILSKEKIIGLEDLPEEIVNQRREPSDPSIVIHSISERGSSKSPSFLIHEERIETKSMSDLNLDTAIRKHIQEVLSITNGNKTQAAKLLGIPRTTLVNKMKKLDLG